jgi:hypothetical protein
VGWPVRLLADQAQRLGPLRFSAYLRGEFGYWPLIVLSALGAGWVFLLDREVRGVAPAQTLVRMSAATALAMPLLVLDSSRIITGILWPGMLATSEIVIGRLSAARARATLARLLPIAALLVIVMVWSDTLVYAGLRSLVNVLQCILWRTSIPGVALRPRPQCTKSSLPTVIRNSIWGWLPTNGNDPIGPWTQ